ncbi:MAG: hypothetical protein PHU93_02550 [Candidatus Gracilibacteria bacterium]|nr:hypothetical protein [Candidatus Gracilibacteria bacterium]
MNLHEIQRRLATSGLEFQAQQEIIRIFDCLSDERKIAIFDQWDSLIARIRLRYERLQEERLVLILDPLDALTQEYSSYVKDFYHQTAVKNLKKLQTNI